MKYLYYRISQAVTSSMIQTIQRMGAGSGGTRNIAGTTIEHVRLELELADLHKKDASLVFGSCYVANVSTIVAIGSIMPNCVISIHEHRLALVLSVDLIQKDIFRCEEPCFIN